ncbi:hypothetical protein [Streptomyces flavofungini]|uniref:hypothetical protein n=1 Tax=Streptomyces flavofungini TaxID=68200 RepID=UPI0034DDFCBC
MKRNKRAAIAVVISAGAGSAAGAVAAYCGLDIEDSVKVGAVVSGAVGNLLYQVFRLTSAQQARENGESDNLNGAEGRRDTARPSNETSPPPPATPVVEGGEAVEADGSEAPTDARGQASPSTGAISQIPGQRQGDEHDGAQERDARREGGKHGAS